LTFSERRPGQGVPQQLRRFAAAGHWSPGRRKGMLCLLHVTMPLVDS